MTHLTEALLGVSTTREQIATTTDVGTTVTQLVPANPNRIQLVFANQSGTTVWIAPASDVAVGEGFPVPSGGGSTALSVLEDGDLVASDWFGIVGSGTVTLSHRAEVARGTVQTDQEGA